MSLYTSKLQKAIHPDFLKDITIKGLHQMCNDYRRLPRYEKRCLCAHIVDNYHVQKNVKDPLLAAHELMQRLVYEVCMFLHAMHAKQSMHSIHSIKVFCGIGLHSKDHPISPPRRELAITLPTRSKPPRADAATNKVHPIK